VQVFAGDAHRAHHATELDEGRLIPSWEAPARADLVLAEVTRVGHHCADAPPASTTALAAVHDPGYLGFLESAWGRWRDEGHDGHAMGFGWAPRRSAGRRPDDLTGQLGWYSFAVDCSITEGTWAAATAAAGLAVAAAEAIVGGAPSAFALCRPPGHHATADQFGGYCYLNNAAVAAQHLRHAGADRVSVLDVDYHHGNGTQDIFDRRGDVQFVSLHADPAQQFPWFSGHAGEVGTGPGHGATRNLPLARGTDATTWLDTLDVALSELDRFGPDAVVVSLGVDTYAADPISDFGLQLADFTVAGGRLAAVGRPTVFVLEGGYATDAIGRNVAAVLDGFEAG
jgi:acetoin utilization deacetylase AcuC-like enzyme